MRNVSDIGEKKTDEKKRYPYVATCACMRRKCLFPDCDLGSQDYEIRECVSPCAAVTGLQRYKSVSATRFTPSLYHTNLSVSPKYRGTS